MIKDIELTNFNKRGTFYKLTCGKSEIGAINRNSINTWTIFPQLPNFFHMVNCESKEKCVEIMTEKLNEFINDITNK